MVKNGSTNSSSLPRKHLIFYMKVAFVYDRVNKIGGAERVLEALHEIWPDAPLYTAVYNPQTTPWAKKFRVVPSFLQKFPFAKSHHEIYPWLTPLAFESFNFDEFDVVVSITSAEAKGIITKPKTLHICYCLTPTRYLWGDCWNYRVPLILQPIISRLRVWDQVASQRPDVYLAISQNVSQRIKKYYHREAKVLYPPVDTKRWRIGNGKRKMGDYFLLVSRLVPYKRVEIVVEAFNETGLPLKVIGTGVEMRRLKKMAKKNIEFLGQLTDQEVLGYYQTSMAVVFPQEEDFGLVPLEALACGKPVVAYGAGGAQETVNTKVGRFFHPQTTKALIETLKEFKEEDYSPETCRQQAKKFDVVNFKKNFKEFVQQEWKTYLNNISLS